MTHTKHSRKLNYLIAAACLAAGLALGWFLFAGGSDHAGHEHTAATSEAEATIWTCSMHPSIRQPEPGDCPICGMELIPAAAQSAENNLDEVRLSDRARRLAGLETVAAQTVDARTSPLAVSGEVAYDEQTLSVLTAHIDARVDRLLVNFEGQEFRAGAPLLQLYSPALQVAQQELHTAFAMRAEQPELFAAARERLRNWKFSDAEIDAFAAQGRSDGIATLTTERGGLVQRLDIREGDYVRTGQRLLTLINLDRLWIEFDLYESDMGRVAVGDSVIFRLRALPGARRRAVIDYIDPQLERGGRVARARCTVDNRDRMLKPGMLAEGTIMTTVRDAGADFLLPAGALLWTGERSLVYVESGPANAPVYTLREVTTGPSTGDMVVIRAGLDAGERVVSRGVFAVDAAAQLAGGRSMMNPGRTFFNAADNSASDDPVIHEPVAVSASARDKLAAALEQYFVMKDALVADDFTSAKGAAVVFNRQFGALDMSMFKGRSHDAWMEHGPALQSLASDLSKSGDIDALRQHLKPLSNRLITLVSVLRPLQDVVYVQYCPMVENDSGGHWLSREDKVLNPYFGASMLHCGEVQDSLTAP